MMSLNFSCRNGYFVSSVGKGGGGEKGAHNTSLIILLILLFSYPSFQLFLQRQRAAVKLENQTENDEDDEELPPDAHNDIDDWITVETEPVANNSDGSLQPTQEEIKQSIRKGTLEGQEQLCQ